MKIFYKFMCIILIGILSFINVTIIMDYKVEKPTEKYNITKKTKTVAKVIEFENTKPNEAIEENLEDSSTEDLEKTSENDIKQENSKTIENTDKNIENSTNNSQTVQEKEETIIETETVEDATPEPIQEETAVEETPQEEVSEPEVTPEPVENGDDIVSTATSYIGYNYVSGGSSPSTGFDCSGFTQYIYGQYGISLNRTAADQAENGTPIGKDELQPGDLVLFSYYGSDSIGHAGIYIGDGQIVHAANSRRGVTIDTIDSGYYADNYVTARRVD